MARKIKWLIAHEPQHLFVRTAEAFSAKLNELTDGEFEVELLTESQYRELHNPEYQSFGFPHYKQSTPDLIEDLRNGVLDMSQTQVHWFGNYDVNYRVFDLPFLFDDHDHATRVFEGPIGTTMGKRLANKAGVRGLAFTYSGGYRVFGSNEPITDITKLAGQRVRVNGNPVNADYVNALGATAVPGAWDSFGAATAFGPDALDNGTLDSVETTYIRFKGKHVLKSLHNMFLTTIIVSNKFWDSLDADMQEKFAAAALEASRLEREWSIADAEKFEAECESNGVSIHQVSEEDKQLMQDAIASVYEKWIPQFQPGLVDGIKKLAH
jgi:TRAP-type C4-dicarboxylate transport system substrate-binding protein